MKDKEFLNQKVKNMSVSELAEAIKIKSIVLRTNEKEPEEWIDITKECEFKPYKGSIPDGYIVDVYHKGKNICVLMGQDERGYILGRYGGEYKLEINGEPNNHFKILKKSGG